MFLATIVVPVDFGPAQPAQTATARAVAGALGLPVLLAYVVEPVRSLPHRPHLPSIDLDPASMRQLSAAWGEYKDGEVQQAADLPQR